LIPFYLGTFVGSLLLSFVLTKYVRDLANARGWVAAPALERHLHSRPLPRFGGVAIFLSFLLTFAIALPAGWHHLAVSFGLSFQTLLTILLPGCLIFALGLYDDIHSVSPYTKVAVQAVAGAMLFAGGLRILDLPVLFGTRHLPWFLGLPLTVLWVLAITNAFNLIDGLDGLAAGSALFSTMVVFAVALVSGSSLVSLMALLLAGSILGFLRFNFSPATIFLGDCGSLFIGFMLSALALQGAQKAPTIIAVAIPVVSFGLPILETALSIVRRYLGGRPVFTADREHIHHKLLQRGLSHRQVVITLYAVSALFALLSLFLLWPTGDALGLVLAVLGTGVWIGVQHLGYMEFGELRRVAHRTIERQILINNLAIRRATEELKVTRDYAQLCRILVAALSGNDFDAFDLRLHSPSAEFPSINGLHLISRWGETPFLRWTKPGSHFAQELTSSWCLTLDLVTTRNDRCGSMTVYRLYTDRELQFDINLLTAVFPVALADALDRTVTPAFEIMPAADQRSGLVAAQAS
jgi:UDP-GlcNAc:undecaprenyl-phosphate/decaprenyl-phosphate GlcNAc-1-phosphate transferase